MLHQTALYILGSEEAR